MLFSLPLLIPFFATVGWQGIEFSTRVEAEPPFRENRVPRNGEIDWLSADPPYSAAAHKDASAIELPALPLWMQAQSWDLRFPVAEPQVPVRTVDTASPAAASFSPAGRPAEAMPAMDGPRDQTFRIPLTGPVFLFGQAEKDGFAPAQGSRYFGQTGVTWKLPVQPGLELLFSCGPEVIYTDALRPDRGPDRPLLPLQTRLLRLDLQCHWRLLGQVGLECQASVCPALNSGEQDAFHEDLHLAFPLTRGGQFLLGAKRYWEKAADIKPAPDSGQLYGDFRLIW
jgi:hypothetical protein